MAVITIDTISEVILNCGLNGDIEFLTHSHYSHQDQVVDLRTGKYDLTYYLLFRVLGEEMLLKYNEEKATMWLPSDETCRLELDLKKLILDGVNYRIVIKWFIKNTFKKLIVSKLEIG